MATRLSWSQGLGVNASRQDKAGRFPGSPLEERLVARAFRAVRDLDGPVDRHEERGELGDEVVAGVTQRLPQRARPAGRFVKKKN